MGPHEKEHVTRLVRELAEPGGEAAADKLMPLVYNELRALAHKYFRNEPANAVLQPTALVHEAYLRLIDQSRVDWKGRTHFFAVAAKAMRRVLIDNARGRRRLKRGGVKHTISLDPALDVAAPREQEIAAVDAALEKLAELDERQARVVELRMFGGLTPEEVAEALGVSKRTVEGDWTHAKAWLRAELSREAEA